MNKPRAPSVTKEGIKEHLLAIIATCDVLFWFCERPAVRGFVQYLNGKVKETDIPKKSAMAESVAARVEGLEEITKDLIKVGGILTAVAR